VRRIGRDDEPVVAVAAVVGEAAAAGIGIEEQELVSQGLRARDGAGDSEPRCGLPDLYHCRGERGTPATAADLAPGDGIVSFGGHAVTSAASLRPTIKAYRPGNKTSVVWADLAGQTHTATVVFATGPAG